ncbi:MAG: M42 family metallopeptidase [Synergistaceae bacterium]|jgi:putative aminopeptidase FrvX|nr:M42 family metallopeptidase [Synergistaceae bacterium]
MLDSEPKIDIEYVKSLTRELLAIPSIAGDCDEATQRIAREFEKYDIPVAETKKRAIVGTWRGRDDERHRLVAAHVDTLGATVRQIKPNGRLRLYPIGGFDWRAFEGENCTVRTLFGREHRGTLMPDHASRHAQTESTRDEAHDMEKMEVRLDVETSSRESTEALGIYCGDPVFFEPRMEVTAEGYVKSRFLDDKLGIAILFGAMKAMKERALPLAHTSHFYISNYEEIGHGTPVIPPKTVEFASIDIGVVAEGHTSDERAVTILARDGVTPYDRKTIRRLARLAQTNEIPFRVDTYLNYGSDASCSVKAGNDVRAVCFGPGVEATHHYERTHLDSVMASARLLTAWLADEIT